MYRNITGHEFGGAGELLQIVATDEAGHGGANHDYQIINVSPNEDFPGSRAYVAEIQFQNGPVPEVGVNGVSEGALLAIVADRLRAFQSGPFACRENALALTKIEEALHWMESRTRQRVERGVEGTLTP